MNTKLFLVVLLLIMTESLHAGAQFEYEIEHRKRETERQAIIGNNLQLAAAEEEAFWAMYTEYRNKVKKMDDRRLALIKRFASAYPELGNTEAHSIVENALRLEVDRQKLKEKYLRRFKSILKDARLFRYYQLETKLDAIQWVAWTQQIPLAPVDLQPVKN